MGQVSTEQTVAIIKAVGDAIPEPVMMAEPNMNYWWLLAIGVIPVVIIPFFLAVKKALSRRKK